MSSCAELSGDWDAEEDDFGLMGAVAVWLIAMAVSSAMTKDSRNAFTPQERMQSDYMHSRGAIWMVIRGPV